MIKLSHSLSTKVDFDALSKPTSFRHIYVRGVLIRYFVGKKVLSIIAQVRLSRECFIMYPMGLDPKKLVASSVRFHVAFCWWWVGVGLALIKVC